MNKNLFETIRNSWNSTMPLHQKINREIYDEAFKNRKFFVFSSDEKNFIEKYVNPKNKNVVQLCCNNGVELMSFKNLGANDCLGIDICDEAIREAQKRCENLCYNIDFVQTNVYDIGNQYDGKFDIIYISVGTIRWLPDLSLLFRICNSLLRKGGKVYISEVHPIAEIINDDRESNKSPLEIIYSYNYKVRVKDYGSLDYVGHTDLLKVERIWFLHSFTDIIGNMINNNFNIIYFEEFDKDIAHVYQTTSQSSTRVPLSFKMISVKK